MRTTPAIGSRRLLPDNRRLILALCSLFGSKRFELLPQPFVFCATAVFGTSQAAPGTSTRHAAFAISTNARHIVHAKARACTLRTSDRYRHIPWCLSLIPLRDRSSLASASRMSSASKSLHDERAEMAQTTTDSLACPQSSDLLPPKTSNKIVNTLDPCVVLMKRMVQEHSDSWKDKGGIFALSQGVVYWTPPEESIVDMQKALLAENSNLHMYGPDEGLLDLREALEAKIAEENHLTNHDVMVTVGANQAYVNCVLTLLDGDAPSTAHDVVGGTGGGEMAAGQERAVVFAPYYFNHVMAIQMCSPESLLVGPCSDDGIPNINWLEQQFQSGQRIQVVTIVNPGNPTGVSLDRSVLQEFVNLCRSHSCWLILDCTYENFIHRSVPAEGNANANGDTAKSHTEFDGCFDDEPHVIHIFSFSKSYALAGYRCGYLALHREALGLYENMLKVQDTVPIAPSRISQVAALGALRAGRSWVAERVSSLAAGRLAILRSLQPLKLTGGTGAMYVMAQLPEAYRDQDQAVARDLVRDFGVAVIPGSFCGFPGWIRVCYSNLPPDLCLQAADRLSKGVQSLLVPTE